MSWEDKNPLYIRDLRNILIFISLNKNIKTKCCAVGGTIHIHGLCACVVIVQVPKVFKINEGLSLRLNF